MQLLLVTKLFNLSFCLWHFCINYYSYSTLRNSLCDNSSSFKTSSLIDQRHANHEGSFYFSSDDRVTLDVLGGKVTSRNTRVTEVIDSDHMKRTVWRISDCAALGCSCGARFSSGACRSGGARARALGRARAQGRCSGSAQGNGDRKLSSRGRFRMR